MNSPGFTPIDSSLCDIGSQLVWTRQQLWTRVGLARVNILSQEDLAADYVESGVQNFKLPYSDIIKAHIPDLAGYYHTTQLLYVQMYNYYTARAGPAAGCKRPAGDICTNNSFYTHFFTHTELELPQFVYRDLIHTIA